MGRTEAPEATLLFLRQVVGAAQVAQALTGLPAERAAQEDQSAALAARVARAALAVRLVLPGKEGVDASRCLAPYPSRSGLRVLGFVCVQPTAGAAWGNHGSDHCNHESHHYYLEW